MRKLIEEIVLEQYDAIKSENAEGSDIAYEGVIRGTINSLGDDIKGMGSLVKGWTEGIAKKREHINKLANDTIEWLKEKDNKYKNLDLDMNSFKTYLKTSDVYYYRYYYILNDSIYNEIVNDLKKDKISELELFLDHFINQNRTRKDMVSTDSENRRSATRMLDNIRYIKDLIVIVEKYRSRVNLIFDLLEKRDRKVKGFPFQLMLRGMLDLQLTVKNIVNLAI